MARARELGVVLPDCGSAPSEHLELRVDAVDPDGAGARFRFGDTHLLVVALNAEGPAGEAWAVLRARVPDAAIACFASSRGSPGPECTRVGWGG